jgi:hypothetical protein
MIFELKNRWKMLLMTVQDLPKGLIDRKRLSFSNKSSTEGRSEKRRSVRNVRSGIQKNFRSGILWSSKSSERRVLSTSREVIPESVILAYPNDN